MRNINFQYRFRKLNTVILLLIVSFLFGFAIWWMNNQPFFQNIWNNFSSDKRAISLICEKTEMNNPVRQPINTFSSVIYLLVGILIIKETIKIKKKIVDDKKIEFRFFNTLVFGLILLYVFVASTFFHASLINLAHEIDYSAVFAFSLFPTFYFFQRNWLIKNIQLSSLQIKIYVAKLSLSFFIIWLLLSLLTPREIRHEVTAVLILIFFGFAFENSIKNKMKASKRYLVYTIISIVIGCLLLKFGGTLFTCNPNSCFQTHSFWNIFMGISGFYFHLYLKSEIK